MGCRPVDNMAKGTGRENRGSLESQAVDEWPLTKHHMLYPLR